MSIVQERLMQGEVIALSGRVDQRLAPELEKVLEQALDQAGPRYLLIDLTAVHYINSSGLRCLVFAWRRTQSRGRELILFGLSQRITQLFETLGVDKIFRIYPDRAIALAHLGEK